MAHSRLKICPAAGLGRWPHPDAGGRPPWHPGSRLQPTISRVGQFVRLSGSMGRPAGRISLLRPLPPHSTSAT